MGLFKTYQCLKCSHTYEGILDVCSKCGARAVSVGGIKGCLQSGRPPGYAGGTSTPHSARSYDRCFEQNFKIMGISNLYHKDGVPVVTRNRSPKMRYNTMPDWAGQQQPIKAYSSQEAMQRDGVQLPPMTIEGRPFQPPQVHPTAQPGAKVGQGLSQTMRANTIITHRHHE
jgi:hypothetical protein